MNLIPASFLIKAVTAFARWRTPRNNPRLWGNRLLREWLQQNPCDGLDVINVSGKSDSDKEGGFYRTYFLRNGCGAKSYRVSNYPGLDLEKPCSPDLLRAFDVVYCNTVLEHIYDVRQAMTTLCALNRRYVILVVPTAQECHFTAAYEDYWRFTTFALRRLFGENGYRVVCHSTNDQLAWPVYHFVVGVREDQNGNCN